ncbi:4-hydroxyphenylpyruvate dioxygenase [Streptosporangium sp. NPDC020145]|uniref:4-hydroxyphenylpyruvate dioxygenase n=1 Tax=Streptosporangium sp. NPDC020145 TaxID=3154694 RepID=UPI003447CFFB
MKHLLAQNENPFGPLPSVRAALVRAIDGLNRYPEFRPASLTRTIAAWQGVQDSEVIVGTGSAGVAHDLFRGLLRPGDAVLHSDPCFDVYPMLCAMAQAESVAVPLGADARHDLAAMAGRIDERTRLIVLCNPHNPTGTVYTWDELTAFFALVPPSAVILLDEAYVDFAPDLGAPEVAGRLADWPNLVVLRTFSKSHGLAALRIGYALANAEIVERVTPHQVPYTPGQLQLAAVQAAIAADDEVRQRIRLISYQRDRLRGKLVELGWSVTPSRTNFLWITAGDPARLDLARAALERHGVAARTYPGRAIRLAVGDQVANDAVITALSTLKNESTMPVDVTLDHIELYVEDIASQIDRLTTGYGFDLLIPPSRRAGYEEQLSALLGQGGIRILLTQPLCAEHPATGYLRRHGDGVADIVLRASDAGAVYTELIERGADGLSRPAGRAGCVVATVSAFGDVAHTLLERAPGVPADRIPGLPDPLSPGAGGVGLRTIDHFAICLPLGELDKTVRRYNEVFGFSTIFSERIEIGALGMDSTVVQNADRTVTFTLIEPLSVNSGGQIVTFLADHGGAGVQHVAFDSHDIVETVGTMARRGVPFLRAPEVYFDRLLDRLTPMRHSVQQLQDLHLLADQDHDGQLYQIFTRSEHPRGTLFFEVIERARAKTFGSNNVRALYEAVELQNSARESTGSPGSPGSAE